MWFVCSTTLPEPGKGGTGNLGNVIMRLVPIFYALCLTHTMLGGGAGWGTGGVASTAAVWPPLVPACICAWGWGGGCGAQGGSVGLELGGSGFPAPLPTERCMGT